MFADASPTDTHLNGFRGSVQRRLIRSLSQHTTAHVRKRSHSYLIIYQRDTSDLRIIAFEREIIEWIVYLSLSLSNG